jgi:hypothetical protein
MDKATRGVSTSEIQGVDPPSLNLTDSPNRDGRQTLRDLPLERLTGLIDLISDFLVEETLRNYGHYNAVEEPDSSSIEEPV